MSMSNKPHSTIESSYRALYGKMFSALINQFGVCYVNEIEDAIQNSFLKSLRTWNTNKIPDNKENWLYIVARNDVINQIKRKNKTTSETVLTETEEYETAENDLRLQTILFISSSRKVSTQAKIVFILKNIFGLNIREISENTLQSQDAIYKSISRAKSNLKLEFENKEIDVVVEKIGVNEISIAEELFYAVFNIGFDSFDERIQSIVNEDLCLEALAFVKLLFNKYEQDSTKNLLALFCFHIARMPVKVNKGTIVSFFNQDKTKWDKNMMDLGFYYLKQPEKLHRFYIEALIVSKHMMANSYDTRHWHDIVELYKLLIIHHNSPIVKLNLCYGLHQAERSDEALMLLEAVEEELPNGHIYFSLVKASILKATDPKESEKIMSLVLNKMEQTIRKEYLLENGFITL